MPELVQTKSWLNRTVLGVGLTSLFSDWSHETATAVLPAFLEAIGAGPAWLGAIEGVADGLSSFSKLAGGYYTDTLKRRKPLHEAIVEMLRREGFSGATVLRGVGGYGGSSVYHTDKLLRLSQDLPVVLEVIETQERIEQILPKLDQMVDGGLITLEKVRVILYRAAKK